MEDKEKRSILRSIIKGEIYAHIESVSHSGMSRRILFFRVNSGKIQKITAEIGELSGELKPEQYKQGGKYVYESGLRVNGCGMDMIFYTLYRCLSREQQEDWSNSNQRYNTL